MRKSKLWRVLALSLTLVMMLSLLAACQSEDKFTALPEKEKIPIVYDQQTEEEKTEEAEAEKVVSKEHGYAIYVFTDEFTFTAGTDKDTIASKDGAYTMTIQKVSADDPPTQPAITGEEGAEILTMVDRRMFNTDQLYEFVFVYPMAEVEGNARLMYAMKDSLQDAE